ncbi:MAG: hypothetical protein IT577_09300 [Verrucomicrobiae bacterium]|nr:hypothetical protein [Verrucomicrobiae bacterium]
MRRNCLILLPLLFAMALEATAADKGSIGLYVWSVGGEGTIAEKTRMRLIAEPGIGDPHVVLRDFAKGTPLQTVANEIAGELCARGFAVTTAHTQGDKILITVNGARSLRVSYSPSTVSTSLADVRDLGVTPVLLAQERVAAR